MDAINSKNIGYWYGGNAALRKCNILYHSCFRKHNFWIELSQTYGKIIGNFEDQNPYLCILFSINGPSIIFEGNKKSKWFVFG